MRVIYFNVWLGKRPEQIISFIERHQPTTDIVCFQEMTPQFAQTMADRFPGSRGYYTERVQDYRGRHGNMIMVWPHVVVEQVGGMSIEAERLGGYPTVVQLMKIKANGGQDVLLGNVHGNNTNGDDSKEQTEDRESHFGAVQCLLAEAQCPRMLVGGDWNAKRGIPALKELEATLGMKNLMDELGIKPNRGRVHRERVEEEKWPFLADGDHVYARGYSSVVVGTEPLLTASDHLPQIIDVVW